MSAGGELVVAMRGITKRFGAVAANHAIDFDLAAGEIHALLGENGSGKTTLMSVLYGLHQPDEGEIRLGGRPVRLGRPSDALARGIAMIPQRFRLVPTLTVAENVALGLDPRGHRHRRLLAEVARRLEALGRRYGLSVEPRAAVASLSMGERQRVEILRALYHDSRVLLMDEPTSVLTPGEVEALFSMIERLTREEGRTVVLVTHKLREAMGHAHRVTVLRQGRRIATLPAAELTVDRLVLTMMGGRAAGVAMPVVARDAATAPVLIVRDLQVAPGPARPLANRPLRGVSFAVRAGELYGVAGVEGNGQAELEFVLAGLLQPTAGEVRMPGAGRAYIPSDVQRWGLVRDFTLAENVLLHRLATARALGLAPALRPGAEAEVREKLVRFAVQPPDARARVQQLSGGNAQKLLLARELSGRPRLIVAAQPTMGLDVAATRFVRSELRRAAAGGAAVIVISSDLDELFEISTTIGVLYHGELQGEWETARISAAAVGAAMAGVRPGASA